MAGWKGLTDGGALFEKSDGTTVEIPFGAVAGMPSKPPVNDPRWGVPQQGHDQPPNDPGTMANAGGDFGRSLPGGELALSGSQTGGGASPVEAWNPANAPAGVTPGMYGAGFGYGSEIPGGAAHGYGVGVKLPEPAAPPTAKPEDVFRLPGVPAFEPTAAGTPPQPAQAKGGKPGKPPPPPTPEQELAGAYAQKEASLRRQQDIEAERDKREAEIRGVNAAKNEEMLARTAAKRDEIAGNVNDQMKQLQADVDSVGKMKPDERQWWTNMSDAGKFFTLLGLAAGGLSKTAARTGKNPALEQVNIIIERNLQSQREQIANARAGVEMKRNLLSMNIQRWGDEVQGMEATRIAYLDQAERMMTAELAKYKSPIRREEIEGNIAQLRADKALAADKFRQQAFENAVKREQLAQGWAHIGMQQDAAKAKGVKPEQLIPATGAPEGFSVAVNEHAAKDAYNKKQALESIAGSYGEIIKLREKYPGKLWDNFLKTSEGLQLIRPHAMNIITKTAVKNGQGALGDQEREAAIKAYVGDLTAFAHAPAEKLWRQQIGSLSDEYTQIMRGATGQNFPRMVYDPKSPSGWRPWVKADEEFKMGGTVDENAPRGPQAPRGLPAAPTGAPLPANPYDPDARRDYGVKFKAFDPTFKR